MCRISYDTVVQQVYVEEPKNDTYFRIYVPLCGKQNAQEKQEQGQGGEGGGGDEMTEADMQLYHKVIF